MSKVLYAAAAALTTFVCVPTASSAAVSYNSAPTVGFHYGNGNDYTPANAAVDDGSHNLAVRFHLGEANAQPAPACDNNGVYSFALGTTPINFDWNISGLASTDLAGNPSALITVTNVGTGQTAKYNPFFVGNDNYTAIQGSAQNSARLNFGFLLGSGFTPNVDNLYRVDLTYGDQSVSVSAQIGADVPEPATWAMMIGGLGLVGGAMRRRTTKVVFA